MSLLATFPTGEEVEIAGIGREGAIGTKLGVLPLLSFSTAVVQLPGIALECPSRHFRRQRSETLRSLTSPLAPTTSCSPTYNKPRPATRRMGRKHGSPAGCCRRRIDSKETNCPLPRNSLRKCWECENHGHRRCARAGAIRLPRIQAGQSPDSGPASSGTGGVWLLSHRTGEHSCDRRRGTSRKN